jgi:HD-GYP domain-containing protein (c-di-GMP phosphodiesterase class II)
MIRRSIDPLITLIAGILFVMGQGILLIPQYLGEIFAGFTYSATVITGFLFHFIGMAALVQVTRPSKSWKNGIVDVLLMVSLSGLAYQLARTGRGLETLLLSGLVLIIPISSFMNGRHPKADQDLPTSFTTLLNLAIGFGLLFWPNFQETSAHSAWIPFRIILGTTFIISSIPSGYVLFHPQTQARRILVKLTVIPWLGWSLICALDKNYLSLIPSIAMATSLLTADLIPWGRLKLPQNDSLGKRFILITAILETIFLVVATSLLNAAEFPVVSNTIGWDSLHLSNRALTFLLILGTEFFLSYGLFNILVLVNGLSQTASGKRSNPSDPIVDSAGDLNWSKRVERLMRPFTASIPDVQKQVELHTQKIQTLNEQLAGEKRRTTQLTMLSELSQQLESKLDMPVASQLAINTLQRSLNCSLAVLYVNEPERHDLMALATAGTHVTILPPGYRQNINTGILGRAARLKKTQVINDSRLDPEFLMLDGEPTLSSVAVPMVDHGYLKALLEISAEEANAFSSSDVQIAEAVAAELLRAWERSDYHQRLAELIQAGISLTAQPDPQKAVEEVAITARRTLRARFTYVTLLDQERNIPRTASAGRAPRLLKSLQQNIKAEPILQAALNSDNPFRVRDLRKYKHASHIDIDHASLRSVIAIPIRVQRQSVGAILAFGKQREVFFTENDESLAGLFASQAAAAIESAWLSNEVRENLISATQLYQLSSHIIQAQELNEAARYIAEAAHKVSSANSSGILLLTQDKKVEAEAQLDASGTHVTPAHPMTLVQRAMESGQSILLPSDDGNSSICFPLKTPTRTYGALWLILPNRSGSRFATNLQTLTNQAAVALERSILLAESRQQAHGLESAYRELETTYDHTLAALMSALDARDRETEGHSLRVARLACRLGASMDLPPAQLKALERGSLLHDIGKIGISDTILLKPGPLNPAEWDIMRMHPDIGVRIVEGIPFLQDAQAVIHYHQERWNGSGYPIGLSGEDIPYLARIFAVADTLDALTSDRPYRERISQEKALQYIHEQAGILFDPEVIQALDILISQESLHPGAL